MLKVLLGEMPETMLENVVPSKSGLRTVLDVLKIQSRFWPNLEPIYSDLQSRWGSYAIQEISEFIVIFCPYLIFYYYLSYQKGYFLTLTSTI